MSNTPDDPKPEVSAEAEAHDGVTSEESPADDKTPADADDRAPGDPKSPRRWLRWALIFGLAGILVVAGTAVGAFYYAKDQFERGGLMVSALVSGSSGPGSSPGRGHCVVFLGTETLLSQCLSPPWCING